MLPLSVTLTFYRRLFLTIDTMAELNVFTPNGLTTASNE